MPSWSTEEKRAYLRDLVNWPLAFLEFIKVTGFYGAAGQGRGDGDGEGSGGEEESGNGEGSGDGEGFGDGNGEGREEEG